MFDWHWLPDRWFFYDLECTLKLCFVCALSCIISVVGAIKFKMGWLTLFQNTGQYSSKTYYMTIICQVAACIMNQISPNCIKVLNSWNGPKWYTIVFTISIITSPQPKDWTLLSGPFIHFVPGDFANPALNILAMLLWWCENTWTAKS